MLTFNQFTGINNVLPQQRMKPTELVVARDVDIGLSGEVSRRGGYTQVSDVCHKNLWQGQGFMLATRGSELLALHPSGAEVVIHPAFGHSRVWYCNLPDGRTTYSNGLLHGVTDGQQGVERSVAPPDDLGAVDVAFGALHPGQYRYCLSFRRLHDGAESCAVESAPITVTNAGGLRWDNLPMRDGHTLHIYLSSLEGEGAYLACSTTTNMAQFTGSNTQLTLPCRTLGAQTFPVGTVTAFWRGRVLAAQGETLWASRPMAPHLADWRDFKPLGSRITAICPVHDGVYVGTGEDLFFLGGSTWEGLSLARMNCGPVVLGSGVEVPGESIGVGEGGAGSGQAMVCIAGGELVAGFGGGQVVNLTRGRYRTEVTEVWAAFRDLPDVGPQYMALPL